MYRKLNDYDVTLETLDSITKKLETVQTTVIKKSCFLGFDGYVDSLYSLVQSRMSRYMEFIEKDNPNFP